VAALPWNQWQLSRGMGGRLRLESVATLVWNTHRHISEELGHASAAFTEQVYVNADQDRRRAAGQQRSI